MLHAHTTVHGPCSPYTGPGRHVNDGLHCPATHICPVTREWTEHLELHLLM